MRMVLTPLSFPIDRAIVFFAGSAVDTGHVGDISHFVRVLSIRIMSSDCWSKESKRESKDEGEMLIYFLYS